ncbi:hypothetical protein [Streptomyces sp. H27-S2]|uniref:hypothetical protein n=1 Tax=Streptomyces antarcticus TaxID=2996458 RepID=UPI00226F097F|nr:hypothetical protein [Streptomyces sp. H27-S2]MCY0949247.1 hypothetical protein [Streptomyces sp. H27-S2]
MLWNRRRDERAAPDSPEESAAGGTGFLIEEYDRVLLLRQPSDELLGPGEIADLVRSAEADAPGTFTVVAGADEESAAALWPRLSDLLDGVAEEGATAVRLVMSGSGSGVGVGSGVASGVGSGSGSRGRSVESPAVAQRIADAWELEVIAPDGTVLCVPGGGLFVHGPPGGDHGWWSFRPGAAPVPLGLRHPAPAWRPGPGRLPSRTRGGCVVEEIPAGVLIRSGDGPALLPGDLCYAVPVDSQGPLLVLGVPDGEDVGAEDVSDVVAALPQEARAALRVAPGGRRDVLGAGQSAADLVGAGVVVYSGLPLFAETGPAPGEVVRSMVIGRDGAPRWQPFVDSVLCAPGASEPSLLRWSPPLPGAGAADRGVVHLSDRWQVAVSRAGLMVGGRDDAAQPLAARPVDAEGPAIEVGRPGEELDTSLWPALSELLDWLEPDLRLRARLHVHGKALDGGRELRRLAARHGVRSVRFASFGRHAEGAPRPGEPQVTPPGTRPAPLPVAAPTAPTAPTTVGASPASAPVPHPVVPAASPEASASAGETPGAALVTHRQAVQPHGPDGSAPARRAAGPVPAARPDPVAAPGPAPLPAARPGPLVEPAPDVLAESGSGPVPAAGPAPLPAVGSGSLAETGAHPLPAARPGPVAEPVPDALAASGSGPVAAVGPKPLAEPGPDPLPAVRPVSLAAVGPESLPGTGTGRGAGAEPFAPPSAPRPVVTATSTVTAPDQPATGAPGGRARVPAGALAPAAASAASATGGPAVSAPGRGRSAEVPGRGAPGPVPSPVPPAAAPSVPSPEPEPEPYPEPDPAPDPAPATRPSSGLESGPPLTTGSVPAPLPDPLPERAAPARRPAIPPASAGEPLPPVPVLPEHRSTEAERTAFRTLAETVWERHAAAVARTLTRMPALRGAEQVAARADLVALLLYLGPSDGPFGHRELERALRAGGGRLLPYAACVASALRRLPSFRGLALRGALPDAAPGAGAGDAGLPRPGTVLRDPAAVSALPCGAAGPEPGSARYAIWSVTGRRVRQLGAAGSSAAHDEVVFAPGTAFRVLDVRTDGPGPLVLLRQLSVSATAPPPARYAEPDGEDHAVLARLDEALRGRPEAPAGFAWPERCAGPLEGAGPEAG